MLSETLERGIVLSADPADNRNMTKTLTLTCGCIHQPARTIRCARHAALRTTRLDRLSAGALAARARSGSRTPQQALAASRELERRAREGDGPSIFALNALRTPGSGIDYGDLGPIERSRRRRERPA